MLYNGSASNTKILLLFTAVQQDCTAGTLTGDEPAAAAAAAVWYSWFSSTTSIFPLSVSARARGSLSPSLSPSLALPTAAPLYSSFFLQIESGPKVRNKANPAVALHRLLVALPCTLHSQPTRFSLRALGYVPPGCLAVFLLTSRTNPF